MSLVIWKTTQQKRLYSDWVGRRRKERGGKGVRERRRSGSEADVQVASGEGKEGRGEPETRKERAHCLIFLITPLQIIPSAS